MADPFSCEKEKQVSIDCPEGTPVALYSLSNSDLFHAPV
jgi:hypothetical protein